MSIKIIATPNVRNQIPIEVPIPRFQYDLLTGALESLYVKNIPGIAMINPTKKLRSIVKEVIEANSKLVNQIGNDCNGVKRKPLTGRTKISSILENTILKGKIIMRSNLSR